MENTVFSDSSTSAAQKRVKSAIAYSLKNKYNIDDEEVTRKILKIHGMDVDNFDVIANSERSINAGLTDTSVDQNSNKNDKTISGLLNEAITNPYAKVLGYRYLYRKMKELYGKSEAKRLAGEMYDLSIALSDSTKILQPYCYAFDFTKLVLEGRPWGQLHSAPPNRLTSYIAALTETVHQLASNVAGAVAISTFFLDSVHVLVYRENIKLFKVKHSKKTRKYIQNSYQSFIHSVNHLSRNSIESPFTNVSIFDRPKLEGLLSKDNMAWYFNEIPSWFISVGDRRQAWTKYIVDYISELQDVYMNFFDKGDKLAGGKPYRFPVTTLNISKNVNNGDIEDEKFLDKISKKEIFRYNIMVSGSSKFANCCRLISQTDMFDMGGQVSSLGLSAISLGSHRVATINFNRIALESKDFDDYFNILSERADSAAKILKAHKELIIDTEKWGFQPFITNGYIKMERLFSTFGVLGLVEGAKTLAKRTGIDEKGIVEQTLKFLNDTAKELNREYKITINIEQIPGETVAVKFHDTDALLYGEGVSEAPLYSNQFLELWKEASIWERMDIDGKFNKLYTGGGIVHFNISDKPTASQVKKLVRYSVKSGSEHFALNSVYSECENAHTTFGNHDVCPECGGKVIEKYTRVVGFMTPISSWNKVRRDWEFPRRVFKNV